MKEKLEHLPESSRTLPDSFHSRTGHTIPIDQCEIVKQLEETQKYARENQMKLNKDKTKLILFNTCKNWDFLPEVAVDDQDIKMGKNAPKVYDEKNIKSPISWSLCIFE